MTSRIRLAALLLLLASCGSQSGTLPAPSPSVVQAPTATPAAATEAATPPAASEPAAPTAATAEPATQPPLAPTLAPSVTPDPARTAPAYTVDADGVVSVWNIDTGLASAAMRLPEGAWYTLAPDGTALAFYGESGVVLADLRSATSTSVVSPGLELSVANAITGFHWSPDSASVLFDSDLPGVDPPQPAMYRADMASGEVTRLGAGIGPAWSPDGALIAYAGAPFQSVSPYGGGPGGMLTLADRAGATRPVSATAEIYPAYQPILWSRDGARVAAGDAVFNAADGTLAWTVVPSDGQVLSAITWLAPDGGSAGVWRSVRAMTPGQDDPGTFDEADEFLLVGEDGSQRLLARSQPGQCPCMPLAPTLWLAWAPDGAHALLAGIPEGESAQGLWLVTTATGERALLADDIATELPFTPLWSPDGHYALLQGFANGSGATWVVPLDGSAPVRVGPGAPLGWSP
jgi:hypothetical protein